MARKVRGPREAEGKVAEDEREVGALSNALSNDEEATPTASDASGRSAQPKLGEVLVAAGAITQVQLIEALEAQQREGKKRRLGEILVQTGTLTEGQVTRALSGQMRLGYADLPTMAIPQEVVQLIPRALADRHQLIPVGITPEGNILVAMSDPTDYHARDDVRAVTGRPVRPVCARPSHVRQAIARYYRFQEPGGDRGSSRAPSLEFVEAVTAPKSEEPEEDFEPSAEEVPEYGHDPDDMRIPLLVPTAPGVSQTDAVDVVDVILDDAVRAGASDIHVEPRAERVDVRFRVDGLLHEVLSIPKHLQLPLISRVKVLATLDIAERRRPQDGRITVRRKGASIDARVSTLPTLHGEKIVIRLLDSSKGLVLLDQLGMTDSELDVVGKAADRSQGFVLVSGPTGSGKTTTLYSLLRQIHRPEKNIVTIEDPVEYQLPGISQVQVDEKTGVTFARALRTVLRQDPDIVMVGEIRDTETAEIAFQASLTGHLVLSTLHTNDAPSAITRLVDMGIEPFLIASSLTLVAAQRLVRRNCTSCSISDSDVAPAVLSSLGISAQQAKRLRRGKGCALCRYTGYQGRVGVYQVLPVTDLLKEQIITQVTERSMTHAAEAAGIKTLLEAGRALALDGVTTAEEVVRVLHTGERMSSTCPRCEGEVKPEFAICPRCGMELAKQTCRACGKTLEPGWQSCPYCSATVSHTQQILVVEDDDDLRTVLEIDLVANGYHVATARNGEEALREATRHRPDLVLLDIVLPDKSGIEVCRDLRRLPETSLVPIVFLTARKDAGTEVEGFEAGADDFLVKPVSRERLLARIGARLRTSTLAV